MRPSPIPDDEIWEGAQRVVFNPPSGDMTDERIRPAEMLVDYTDKGPRICARIVLEPGDLERLEVGEPFWVVFIADHLHPFDVTMRYEESDDEH